MPNFIKIRPAGAELFHADMTKLTAAFHNFANALQKAGIYIKMSAAAKPSEVFLHPKREFKNVNPILSRTLAAQHFKLWLLIS